MAAKTVLWRDDPEDRHVQAAETYLTLVERTSRVDGVMAAFRGAPNVPRAAKDLLRASRLPLLPPDDPHVARDLRDIRHGVALSPILAVRGDLQTDVPLTIADGYHRLCACYHVNENAEIPCRIVDQPSAPGVTPTRQRRF